MIYNVNSSLPLQIVKSMTINDQNEIIFGYSPSKDIYAQVVRGPSGRISRAIKKPKNAISKDFETMNIDTTAVLVDIKLFNKPQEKLNNFVTQELGLNKEKEPELLSKKKKNLGKSSSGGKGKNKKDKKDKNEKSKTGSS